MQTQDDRAPMTDAILSARGTVRGVADPLSAELACADFLRLVENSGMALSEKGDTGPSRVDRLPDPPYFAINE
jgi:hypothetical protein